MADWTQAEWECCVALWRDGYSAAVIAGKIGKSRNSILGRVHRMGMSNRPRRVETITASRQVNRSNRHFAKSKLQKPSPPPEPPPLPVSNPVTFADLRKIHCRWPLGDPRSPEFRYCGAPRESGCISIEEGSPYCAAHAIMAKGRDAR